MSSYAGIDLPKLVALVRARAMLLTAITLAAAAVAFIVSHGQSERFRATSVLLFGGTPRAEILVEGGSSDDSTAPEQAAATNVALASLDSVAARVKRRLGTPATVSELKGAIDVEARGQSDLVDVTAEWGTPHGAALLATTFAEEVVATRRELAQSEIQRAIDALNRTIQAGAGGAPDEVASLKRRLSQLVLLKAVQTGDARLADPASPPHSPSSPRPVFNAIAAGLAALILGLGAVVLLAGFDQRIRDESELAALIDAPVLARIPEVARSRRFMFATGRDEDASFVEAIQFLRLNVQRTRPDGQGLVVAVTSPLAGDGKTMVVAWLAQSLALNEAEVVAVDCDLRNPTLHTYFDAGDELGGVLSNLRLVPAGDHAALPVDLAGQEPMRRMFDGLRDQSDYVVVDTAPVASVAHASAVAAVADEVILVVDLERIRRKNLMAAKEQLENARAKVLGIVLNRVATDVRADYTYEEVITKSDIASKH